MKKLLLIIILLLFVSPVWSATYYVKTGGNDESAGTSDETAWATIAKVNATVTSGDTVYFRSQDTWTGTTTILDATAGVTYNGDAYGSGTRARFQATGDSTNGNYGLVNINESNVTFKGFEVYSNQYYGTQINIGYGASTNISYITVDNCNVHSDRTNTAEEYYYGILVTNRSDHTTSNVTIQNSEVHHTGHEGISVYPSWMSASNAVDTVLVRNNKIHDSRLAGAWSGNLTDVALRSSNVTFEFNTIYNSTLNGFAVVTYSYDTDYGSPSNVTFRYNLLYNCLGISINVGTRDWWTGNNQFYGNIIIDGGIGLSPGDYNSTSQKFYNNTIYTTKAINLGAISLYEGATNTSGIEIKNNIVYATDGYAFYDWDQLLSTSQHTNNLYYKSSGNLVNLGSGGTKNCDTLTTWEPTAICTNPSFPGGTLPKGFSGTYGTNMVPDTDYFQLTVDSPAKDAGATLASYTGAINGAGLTTPIVRPLGAAFDIGAYEYGTVAQSGGSAGQGFKIQGVTIR